MGLELTYYSLRAHSHLTTATLFFCRQVQTVSLVAMQPISVCRQKWVQHPFLTTKIEIKMDRHRQVRTDP